MRHGFMLSLYLGHMLCAILWITLYAYAGSTGISILFTDEIGHVLEENAYEANSKIFGIFNCLKSDTQSCSLKLVCERRAFDLAVNVLERPQEVCSVCADDISSMLYLAEHLALAGEHGKKVFYTRLAEITKPGEDFRKEIEKYKSAPSFGIYMLQLLRRYMDAYGLIVAVKNSKATICTKSKYKLNKYGSREVVDVVNGMKILKDAMHSLYLAGKDRLCMIKWFANMMDIRSLDLSKCNMDIVLMECIRGIACLRSLSLRCCKIETEHLNYLRDLSLVELDISENRPYLAERFIKKVRRLIWKETTQNSLSVVGELRSVKKLNLADCGLMPGCLKQLEQLRPVELDVSGNTLGEDDMHVIGKMENLTKLGIKNCQLSPGRIAHLQKLTRLTDLEVALNALEETDLQVIGGIERLTKLSMVCCKMKPGSLEYIQGLVTLKELRVSILRGFLCRRDLLAIAKIRSLVMLDIGDFVTETEDIGCLWTLVNLEKLVVSKARLNIVDALGVSRIKNIRQLYIDSGEMESGCLEQLKYMQHLEELNVSTAMHKLSKSDILSIKSIQSLKYLGITMCKLEEGCLEGLQGMRNLKVICFFRTKLSHSNVLAIEDMASHLWCVRIRDCDIDSRDLRDLHVKVLLCAFN